MGILEGLKGTISFGKKFPSLEETDKEIMRLEMQEQKYTGQIKRLRSKWSELYKKGEDADKYERRQLLRKMERVEEDLAQTDLELDKINMALKGLSKIKRITSKGQELFKGEYWEKVQKNVDADKLWDWIVEKNYDEKKVLKNIAEIAGIEDQNVMDEIDRLPDVDTVWPTAEVKDEDIDKIRALRVESKKKSMSSNEY